LDGFRELGTRLTIEAVDAPGKSSIVIGINSLNTADIEKSIEEQGFKVLYKLQNKYRNYFSFIKERPIWGVASIPDKTHVKELIC